MPDDQDQEGGVGVWTHSAWWGPGRAATGVAGRTAQDGDTLAPTAPLGEPLWVGGF